MSETQNPHPGPAYSFSEKPSAAAVSAQPRASTAIPTKEEFVAAGYKADGYDAFVADLRKASQK